MELWLTLVALYAWQCMASLPVQSAVFGPRWLGWSDLHRRGVLALSPWPSTLGTIASRLPFQPSDDDGGLVLTGADALAAGDEIALDGLRVETRGVRLVANGRPFAKAASKAQARVWHHVVASLAATSASQRRAAWDRILASTLDGDALESRLEAARRATRWLAIVCDADLITMFLLVPFVGLLFGSEYALFVSGPTLGGLHLVALAFAFFAHRRLFPERRGERFEELFMAALYPPALLRRPQAWVDAATAGFHPLAWVRVLADDDEGRRVWLRECAWLERRAERLPDQAAGLRAELEAISRQAPAAWREGAARSRTDPMAESYCPVCWDDFRTGYDRCASCDAETVRYASAPG